MYNVYVLQSLKNGSIYIGQTTDLDKRINRHNRGYENYTSKCIPWKLVCSIQVPTRKDALKLERYLKNLHSPKKVMAWFESRSDRA